MATAFEFLHNIPDSPKSYRTGELRWSPGDTVVVKDAALCRQLRALPFMKGRDLEPAPVAAVTAPSLPRAKYDDPDLEAALGGSWPGDFDDEGASAAPKPAAPALGAAGSPAGQPAKPKPAAKPNTGGKQGAKPGTTGKQGADTATTGKQGAKDAAEPGK